MQPMDSYIICGTPRTGSTLLCGLLASTKVAGDPDSFFMGDLDPVWVEHWGLPVRGRLGAADYGAAYLQAAIRAGRGQTGVFGLRLMRRDLGALLDLIDGVFPGLPSDRSRLEAAFGRVLFIHLAREDKLAQAISMVKAEQSGLWHVAADGSELERLSPPRDPHYDFGRIALKVAELERYDAAWLTWFAGQAIEPLCISYEILSEDPAGAVARICKALGVPEPAPGSLEPGVSRLADAVTLEWMRRYRLDLATIAPGRS